MAFHASPVTMKNQYPSLPLRYLIVLAFLVSFQPGFSQLSGTDPLLKPAELELRITGLADTPEGDEEGRKALADFREALRISKAATDAAAKAEEFRKSTQAAPAELEKLSVVTPAPATVAIPENAPLEKVANLSDVARATLEEAKAELKARKAEAKGMVARQSALPGLIAEAKAELAALPKPEATTATSTEQQKAASQRDLAQRNLLKAEIAMFLAEMDYLESAPVLLSAEIGLLNRRISTLAQNTEILRQRVERMKLDAAGDEIARTRAQAEGFPVGSRERKIADEVMELALRHGGKDGLREKIAASAADISVIESRTDKVSKQFGNAKERVQLLEEVGLSIDPATGRLLRAQRQKLPSESEYLAKLQDAVEESAQVQIERLIRWLHRSLRSCGRHV
jgi:hypothetical protein